MGRGLFVFHTGKHKKHALSFLSLVSGIPWVSFKQGISLVIVCVSQVLPRF